MSLLTTDDKMGIAETVVHMDFTGSFVDCITRVCELAKSQEERISTLLQSKSKYEEATATLQSERDANAILTADIERKDALLAGVGGAGTRLGL